MERIKDKPRSGADMKKSTGTLPSDSLLTEIAREQPVGTDSSNETDNGLDLVRKILFGEQVRETERKQASLERYVRDSVEALNKETQQQILTLQGEVRALSESFEQNVGKQRSRKQSVDQHFSAVEQSINNTAEQAQKNYLQLDKRLQQQSENLESKLGGWRKDILHQLEQTKQQLQHDKADRKSIAVLFQDMAQQLARDE